MSAKRDVQVVKDLKTVFPVKNQDPQVKAVLEGSYGVQDATPIFVVGLPRSGSTLTEQIFASHPQAFGAGVRPNTSSFCLVIPLPSSARLLLLHVFASIILPLAGINIVNQQIPFLRGMPHMSTK